MVLNPDKCSFMLLGVDDSLKAKLVCSDEILKSAKQEKVLGVTLDNKLNFDTHLLNINPLTRVQNDMNTDQKSLYFPPSLNCNLPIVR